MPGEADGHDQEQNEHRHAEEGVQDARPHPVAEQAGQPEQRRMEQRQPGQPGEEEQDGHGPVVGPLRGGVTLDLVFHRWLPEEARP
ncbi:hypothetical protein D3C78_1676820 [compost metagenome]